MIPSHWTENKTERLQNIGSKINKAIEDFQNNSDKKVFQQNVRRQMASQGLLMTIGLEERRNKLRNLIETDDKIIAEEHTKRIETMEARRTRLIEYAHRIRNQKELERQALATEKYFQRDRQNDGNIRSLQSDIHLAEIIKDWEKLKDIKERIKREQQCEAEFWAAQVKEEQSKLLERESKHDRKVKDNANDILGQIKENERQREIDKENQLKMRDINSENVRKLHEDIEQERKDAALDDRRRKEEFRKALDRHLQIKHNRSNVDKGNEDAFNKIMKDENLIKLKENTYARDLKKRETLKSLKHFLDQQNCIKEAKKVDNRIIENIVQKLAVENHKKRVEFEYQEHKRYVNLVKSIKATNQEQLNEIEKKKVLKAQEIQKEKESMAEFIAIESKKEIIKNEQEKEKMANYIESLKDQISFNGYLNRLSIEEKQRELNSLKKAEEDYQALIKKIKDKEELLFKHPWRSHSVEN